LITALVAEQVPRGEWSGLTWLDPFSGGGAVSLYAKAQGFNVVASDLATRAVIVSRALVQNSSVRLTESDVVGLFTEDGDSMPARAARHVPDVFSAEQAAWIDRALAAAARRTEPVRSLLELVVLKVTLGLHPMSVPTATDARAAVEGEFDRISPRRLGHYLRASDRLTPERVLRVASDVNGGVFGGIGRSLRGDAHQVIAEQPADVLYLDPPYAATSGYRSEYGVIDELLDDGEPPGEDPPTLDELIDAGRDIPLLVLSYGGPTQTLDQLEAVVSRHRLVSRALAVPYPHLRSIASSRKNRENREYIIIAGR